MLWFIKNVTAASNGFCHESRSFGVVKSAWGAFTEQITQVIGDISTLVITYDRTMFGGCINEKSIKYVYVYFSCV